MPDEWETFIALIEQADSALDQRLHSWLEGEPGRIARLIAKIEILEGR